MNQNIDKISTMRKKDLKPISTISDYSTYHPCSSYRQEHESLKIERKTEGNSQIYKKKTITNEQDEKEKTIRKLLISYKIIDQLHINYISFQINLTKNHELNIENIIKSIFLLSIKRKTISYSSLSLFLKQILNYGSQETCLELIKLPFFLYLNYNLHDLYKNSKDLYFDSYKSYMNFNIKMIVLNHFHCLNKKTYSFIPTQYFNRNRLTLTIPVGNVLIYFLLFTPNQIESCVFYNKELSKSILLLKSNILFSILDYSSNGYINLYDKVYKYFMKILVFYCIFQSDYLINSFFSYRLDMNNDLLYNIFRSDHQSKSSKLNESRIDIHNQSIINDIIIYKKYIFFMSDPFYMNKFLDYITKTIISTEGNNNTHKMNRADFLNRLNVINYSIFYPLKVKEIFLYYISNALDNESKLFFSEIPKIFSYYHNQNEIGNIYYDIISIIDFKSITKYNMYDRFIRYDLFLNNSSLFCFYKSKNENLKKEVALTRIVSGKTIDYNMKSPFYSAKEVMLISKMRDERKSNHDNERRYLTMIKKRKKMKKKKNYLLLKDGNVRSDNNKFTFSDEDSLYNIYEGMDIEKYSSTDGIRSKIFKSDKSNQQYKRNENIKNNKEIDRVSNKSININKNIKDNKKSLVYMKNFSLRYEKNHRNKLTKLFSLNNSFNSIITDPNSCKKEAVFESDLFSFSLPSKISKLSIKSSKRRITSSEREEINRKKNNFEAINENDDEYIITKNLKMISNTLKSISNNKHETKTNFNFPPPDFRLDLKMDLVETKLENNINEDIEIYISEKESIKA